MKSVVGRWMHGWRAATVASAATLMAAVIGLGVASASTQPVTSTSRSATDSGLLTFYPIYNAKGPACVLSRAKGPDALTATLIYDQNGNAQGCELAGFPANAVLIVESVEPAFGQGSPSAGIQDVHGNGTAWDVDGTGGNVNPNVFTFIAVR